MRVVKLWIDRFANYNQATRPLEIVVEKEPSHCEARTSSRRFTPSAARGSSCSTCSRQRQRSPAIPMFVRPTASSSRAWLPIDSTARPTRSRCGSRCSRRTPPTRRRLTLSRSSPSARRTGRRWPTSSSVASARPTTTRSAFASSPSSQRSTASRSEMGARPAEAWKRSHRRQERPRAPHAPRELRPGAGRRAGSAVRRDERRGRPGRGARQRRREGRGRSSRRPRSPSAQRRCTSDASASRSGRSAHTSGGARGAADQLARGARAPADLREGREWSRLPALYVRSAALLTRRSKQESWRS